MQKLFLKNSSWESEETKARYKSKYEIIATKSKIKKITILFKTLANADGLGAWVKDVTKIIFVDTSSGIKQNCAR